MKLEILRVHHTWCRRNSPLLPRNSPRNGHMGMKGLLLTTSKCQVRWRVSSSECRKLPRCPLSRPAPWCLIPLVGVSIVLTVDLTGASVFCVFVIPYCLFSVKPCELNFWATSAINDQLFNTCVLHAQRVLLSSHPQSFSGSLHIHKNPPVNFYFFYLCTVHSDIHTVHSPTDAHLSTLRLKFT